MSKLDTQISPGTFDRNQPNGAKRMDNKLVPTFLQKTYALVNNREFQDIVTWGDEPSTFVIYDPNRFAREVLPRHFKQNKMSSFVRQLNMYDFHKKTSQDNKHHIFFHPNFQKGNEALLSRIKRKKSSKKGNRDASSMESFSLSDKRKRSRFFEEYRKSKTTLEGLEVKIKDLVKSFTSLLDECKTLTLGLNNFKKEIRDKVDIIMYHLYQNFGVNAQGMPNPGGAPPVNQLALTDIAVPNAQIQYSADGTMMEQVQPPNQARPTFDAASGIGANDPRPHKTYRVVDEAYQSFPGYSTKDVYNMMNKPGVLPTIPAGGRHGSFYNEQFYPNGKLVYNPGAAPLEIMDREAVGLAYDPNVQPVYPRNEIDSVLDLSRSGIRNGGEVLGKRNPNLNEMDYLASLSPNLRKKSMDPALEPFMSPMVPGGVAQSPPRISSPAHSAASGFRLHHSRKDSELKDFNNEVLLTKSKSYEELPGSSA